MQAASRASDHQQVSKWAVAQLQECWNTVRQENERYRGFSAVSMCALVSVSRYFFFVQRDTELGSELRALQQENSQYLPRV